MKIWTPTVGSSRIRFSQRFQNLSHVYGAGGQVSGSVSVNRGIDLSGGGYVRYLNYASSDIWQLPWWSVYVQATIPAAGSARTLPYMEKLCLRHRFGNWDGELDN